MTTPLRFTILLLFCGWCLSGVLAQSTNLGIPPVWNFSKKNYLAGTQNWDATQDQNGVMYWANNEGLLQYDGTNWHCFPVSNRTVVRSVRYDPARGLIFIGAQSELGYFYTTSNGQMAYQSLVHLLPEGKRNFEDVWDIVFYQNEVFFRTNDCIFQYNGQEIKIYDAYSPLTAMFVTPAGLFIQQNLSELLLFEQGKFTPIYQIQGLKSPITGAINWSQDTLLFPTLKNGIFYLINSHTGQWATTNDPLLREQRIYAATALPNGHLALGTSLGGLITIDRNRRIHRHFTKKNGLQNNNILSTFTDRAGNLWLGLDSGIDCVVLDAPFSTIIPDGELGGTGYAAGMVQNRLYLGVSNGVYTTPWHSFYNPELAPFFQKINSTDGQVWSLQVLENTLLMGHHEGAFQLNGLNSSPISTVPGGWTFVQLTHEYAMGGTYSGLVLYRKSGDQWLFDQVLKGLNESCRFMVKDADGTVWVAHPYRGLYRVEWSPERKSEIKVTFFNSKNGLPSDINNSVFLIAGKAVFSTEKGVMRFDKNHSVFTIDDDFDRLLHNSGRVRHLKEDLKGNIWYVSDKEAGVLEIADFGLKKSVTKKVFPELAPKLVSGFEFIYPIDQDNILFGAEQGFIHFNAAANTGQDTFLQVVLSNVSARGRLDSVLMANAFEGTMQRPESVLPFGVNNLRFSFSATDFKDPGFIQYRVWLVGLDRGWSEWTPETVRNFTNLNSGKYAFKVQARRKDGRLSAVVAYAFRIQPPWYATAWAMTLYGLAIIGGFAGFVWYQRKRFENEKEQLTVQHQQVTAEQQREVEETKAVIHEIQGKKLAAEIQFKNQELASATMHLVQKGEILLTVKENLNQILEKSTNPAVKKEIQQLLNLLNFDAQLDEDWEHFALHFDQVHVDFLKRLREQFPQLSTTDYKLCAYLRMNLSTKEIAPLMNISIRGVEASRYRLRKKLDLPNEINLTDVILRL